MKFHQLAHKYPNKTALITGAGSGLGWAFTELLLKDDWKVIGIDLNIDRLSSLNNNKLSIHQLDITDQVAFEKLLLDIISVLQIDLLFNNAGVGEGSAFIDYELENWDWIINVNLKAHITASKTLLPHFLSNNNGLIVNISSAAGYSNLPNMSPYNVTKAGMIALSETLAHELTNTNVNVKLVTPTFFQSSIMDQSRGDQDKISSASKIINKSKLNSLDAAAIILSQLHKKSEAIRFPFSAKALYYGKQFLPRLFRWSVRKFLMKKA